MAAKLVEITCELCLKPAMVRANSVGKGDGRGRFHRRCAQIARAMGKKNANYGRKFGASYHTTILSAARRAVVRARDGNKCQHCGVPSSGGTNLTTGGRLPYDKQGKRLDIHHIVPVGDGGSNDDDNLITLCRRCHIQIETGREKLGECPASALFVRREIKPLGFRKKKEPPPPPPPIPQEPGIILTEVAPPMEIVPEEEVEVAYLPDGSGISDVLVTSDGPAGADNDSLLVPGVLTGTSPALP